MTFTENAITIFNRAIADYHVKNSVNTPIQNPYPEGTIENRLYLKNWIDTVQWHYEDIIRDPKIDPAEALVLNRQIQSGPHRSGRADRRLVLSKIQRCTHRRGSNYKYRNSSLGYRPPLNTPAQDLSYERGGNPRRCKRRAQREMPSETQRAAHSERRPFKRDRGSNSGHCSRTQVHESVQADEDVQRPFYQSGALQKVTARLSLKRNVA